MTSHLKAADNLILVTLDGVRWQEVFYGIDKELAKDKQFVKHPNNLSKAFWDESEQVRREKLFPFLWQTIAREGVVIGDRLKQSNMSVANPWYFSYPGYSEIVTGIVDEKLDSNHKIPNPHISFIEYLNGIQKYEKKLAVFAGWDVFEYIFNKTRSNLYINSGFNKAQGYALSPYAKFLNSLQDDIPSPWHNVRLDAFTYGYAKDYLLNVQPRVMMIALGETDDFAHDGRYDQYIRSARRSDQFIADLWNTLQNHTKYKNNTHLIITTDHGRGSTDKDWQHHASVRAVQGYLNSLSHFQSGIVGAEHIWFAAIGPKIKAQGLLKTNEEVYQNQIAATALLLLGESKDEFNAQAGDAILEIIK